jgi:threonine dehydratase
MLKLADIEEAYERIRHAATRTPVMTSSTIDRMTKASVFFKCENFQRAGAFKFRGAFNTLSQLTDDEREHGVIAHSSGNHAQALSLAASILRIKVTIVMPSNSPQVKVNATKGYGANVVFCEPTLEGRESTTQELIDRHGVLLIHPYNDERIIAGAGTAAYELIQEIGELDYVFAPVGGGGLLSGTSIATKGLLPEARIVASEPANADDAYRSFTSGELIPIVNPDTIADGLKTSLGTKTFPIIMKNVDEIVRVSEIEIVDAMRLLWERMKLVVEPSGAVSLASALKKRGEIRNHRVGVIISGGNVDLDVLFDMFFREAEERSC